MYIAVDFDGTCVAHEFPEIGVDIGAVPVLKKLVAAGHKLILHTMRGEEYLEAAVDWFKEHDIELFGVNDNHTQVKWTSSRKVYAHLYIDDAALGCPLQADIRKSPRPFVDWKEVERRLIESNILPA